MTGEKPGAVNHTGLFLLYFKNGFVHAGKSGKGIFLALRKKYISCGKSHAQQGPEGFKRATGKPFGRLRRGETFCDAEKVG